MPAPAAIHFMVAVLPQKFIRMVEQAILLPSDDGRDLMHLHMFASGLFADLPSLAALRQTRRRGG